MCAPVSSRVIARDLAGRDRLDPVSARYVTEVCRLRLDRHGGQDRQRRTEHVRRIADAGARFFNRLYPNISGISIVRAALTWLTNISARTVRQGEFLPKSAPTTSKHRSGEPPRANPMSCSKMDTASVSPSGLSPRSCANRAANTHERTWDNRVVCAIAIITNHDVTTEVNPIKIE